MYQPETIKEEKLPVTPFGRWIPLIIPSLADWVAIITFLMVLLFGSKLINVDGDMGRHIRVGELILQMGAIPHTDLISYTRYGDHYVAYEWGTEVILALLNRALGLYGPVLMIGLIVAVIFWVLFRQLLQRNMPFFLACGFTVMSILLSSIHWLPRPHMFTALFFLFWYLLLDYVQRGGNSRRAYILTAILTVIWVNLHGGFVIGLMLLGLYWGTNLVRLILPRIGLQFDEPPAPLTAKEGIVRFSIIGAIMLVASGVNPAGYELLPYVMGFLTYHFFFFVDITDEFLSPNFHVFPIWIFTLELLSIIGILALPRSKGLRIIDIMVIGFFTALSLYSARHLVFFSLIAPLAVASILQSVKPLSAAVWYQKIAGIDRRWATFSRLSTYPIFSLLFILVMIAGIAGYGFDLRSSFPVQFSTKRFPVEAVNYLRDHPQSGNMYNRIDWGGYLLYAYPQARVFIDAQTDFYGEKLTQDYLTVEHVEPGWQDVLDRYHVNWVLYDTNSSLSSILQRDPGWQVVYTDQTATIFVRKAKQ